jgi:hypothetical protein
MREIFLAAIALISFLNTYSQNLNPYEQFGYKTKYQYVRTKKDDGLYLVNADSIATNKNLLISLKSKQIFILDEKDSAIWVANIPEETFTRFIRVDPLTKKYPELTPYQFASDTPIQAIDLDGLEAFIVPGTRQTEKGAQFSTPLINELKRIGNNTQSDETFRWNAPLTNKESDRKDAAEKLVQHIWDVRAEMIKNGKISDQEPITLVGYSHGGNVAIQAAEMLKEKYDARVNLITLSTPAYTGKGDAENPTQNDNIHQHYQFVHQNDEVTTFWARGSQTYNNGKTINYVITDKQIPIAGGKFNVEPHFLPYHSEFVNYLKNIPAMTTPPGNTGFLDDFIKASLNRK